MTTRAGCLNREVTFVGTIAGLDFVNPHAWLRVHVTAPDGTVTLHRCEMRGATVLRRSGWTPEMFVVGERITVQGAPDRVDPRLCYVNTLALADGRKLDRYTQQAGVATAGRSNRPPIDGGSRATSSAALPRTSSGVPNLAGAWAVEQQLMTDPRGRLGTLVPASVATQFAPGAVPKQSIAIPGSEGSGALALLYASYRVAIGAVSPAVIPWIDALDWYWETVVHRVSQNETSVSIEYGQHGFVRTIHLDTDRHPERVAPSRGGHSFGFSLNADGSVLTREYVAEDSDYFVGEYRGSDVTPRSPLPFVRDTCSAELNPVAGNQTGERQ